MNAEAGGKKEQAASEPAWAVVELRNAEGIFGLHPLSIHSLDTASREFSHMKRAPWNRVHCVEVSGM